MRSASDVLGDGGAARRGLGPDTVTSARAVLRRLRPRRISHSGCCPHRWSTWQGRPYTGAHRRPWGGRQVRPHGVDVRHPLPGTAHSGRHDGRRRHRPLAEVVVGAVLGAAILPITAVTGMAFLGFAVWTLRGDGLDDADEAKASRVARSAAVVAAACFLAELGDKVLARSPSPPSRGSLAPGSGPRWAWSPPTLLPSSRAAAR